MKHFVVAVFCHDRTKIESLLRLNDQELGNHECIEPNKWLLKHVMKVTAYDIPRKPVIHSCVLKNCMEINPSMVPVMDTFSQASVDENGIWHWGKDYFVKHVEETCTDKLIGISFWKCETR